MTHKLSPDQQKILRLSCVSYTPNIWRWEAEEIVSKPKTITKQRRFINDSLSIFMSNLTVNLGNDLLPLDTNLSCALHDTTFGTNERQNINVTCTQIFYNFTESVNLRVYDGILYSDCHNRRNKYSNHSEQNCAKKIECAGVVDDADYEGSEYPNWNQCDDLDSCYALLLANVRENTSRPCPDFFASNLADMSFSATPPANLFPQVFTCSYKYFQNYLGGWKSYLPFYPSFRKNISADFMHYMSPSDAQQDLVRIFELLDETEIQSLGDTNLLSNRTRFAENETVTFACIAAGYLYMNGFKWKLNNLALNGNPKDIRTDDGLIVSLINVKLNTLQPGLVSYVSSFAPTWNTYKYERATNQIFIYQSTLPHANLTCEKAEYFFRCVCTYTGWPKPVHEWNITSAYKLSNEKHTMQEDHKPPYTTHPHELIWQTYMVISVHPKNESIISCKVYNVRGKHEDNFRFQPEGKSSLLVLVLVPILVFVIMFAVTATYFVKRYRTKYILSRQDLNVFFQGNTKLPNEFKNGSKENEAIVLPYNIDRYEINKGDFQIDSMNRLGSGISGVVCKGSIQKDGMEVNVAVKRVKNSENSSTKALKGLLSEIKILSYVGNHNHIVSLVGANTAELKTGKLFAFIELCEMGSLETFLHTMARSVEHTSQDEMQIDLNLKQDLSRWSKEIANGMEYLAFKKVVHADLATRNILLTSDKCAKISDFGLSRRLYEYKDYVKKHQEPLPWRWMAPESLRRLEFNEKTDVCITLWEIYTLGDKPYSGLSFDSSFCALLQEGYRCGIPVYADNEMFEIMKSCWENCPNLRPSFSMLKTRLTRTTYVNVED